MLYYLSFGLVSQVAGMLWSWVGAVCWSLYHIAWGGVVVPLRSLVRLQQRRTELPRNTAPPRKTGTADAVAQQTARR